MKVKIGPYLNWYGPYQIADIVFFWTKHHDEVDRWDYRLKEKFGNWLSNTKVLDACNWIHEKRKRTEIVKIHSYDTWSMDHTLSLIIHPMLVQLKNTNHGTPYTDDDDVPEHLRSTNAGPKKEDSDTDNLFFARWDWIQDEMIWAFGQTANDDPEEPESKFLNNASSFQSYCSSFLVKADLDGFTGATELCSHEEKQEDWDKYRVDLAEFSKRKKNAYMLFGKYYCNLWD